MHERSACVTQLKSVPNRYGPNDQLNKPALNTLIDNTNLAVPVRRYGRKIVPLRMPCYKLHEVLVLDLQATPVALQLDPLHR